HKCPICREKITTYYHTVHFPSSSSTSKQGDGDTYNGDGNGDKKMASDDNDDDDDDATMDPLNESAFRFAIIDGTRYMITEKEQCVLEKMKSIKQLKTKEQLLIYTGFGELAQDL